MRDRAEAIRDGISLILEQGGNVDVQADHDIIYVSNDTRAEEHRSDIRSKMISLGWHMDKSYHCWAFLV